MLFAAGVMFGLVPAAFAIITLILLTIHKDIHKMALDLAGLQAKLSTLSTDVAALIAAIPVVTPPVDLQPAGDAVDALDATVKAATPVAPVATP